MELRKEYGLLIGGEWMAAQGGKTTETRNPATDEVLARVAAACADDVDRAVKAARAAFDGWSKTSPAERSAILLRIADDLEKEADFFAKIETLDNGKPIRETSLVDVPLSVDHFRYFAGCLRAEEGSAVRIDNDTMSLVLHEPIGVVGQIIPWNFPLLMGAWKLAPALAAGNTVVIKPSSTTPLSLLHLAEIISRHVPAGVVNVITGSGRTAGDAMLKHPGFDKLAFTGSTEVGVDVARAAADRLIPATLELGGKSANILFADCNLERAIEGVQIGILFNQGQVCCAGSRLFIERKIYDQVLERLSEAFKAVKVGDPMDPATQMGAQINEAQVERVLRYVEIAKKDGARILAGGERAKVPGLESGAFMQPTLIADVKNDQCVAQEEIFGPLLPVLPYDDEDAMIEKINSLDHPLALYVFSGNRHFIRKITSDISFGGGCVNDTIIHLATSNMGFGGVGGSGMGSYHGREGFDTFTHKKSIVDKKTWLDLPMRYQPYSSFMDRMIRMFLK